MAGASESRSSQEPTSASSSSKSHPSREVMEQDQRNPNIFETVWSKTGLDAITVKLMLKGALAPAIAIAAYQDSAWAAQYTTLGYLAAIMALLSLTIQPRAKFLQSMMNSILFTCVGAAIALLQIQCTVAARQSTTRSDGRSVVGQSGSLESVEYNAAASTVSGIGLFLTIWIANTVRAFRPALTIPTIQYSIFSVVTSTYAHQFPNMIAGKAFVRRLLITFLTGFGLGTGVSLLVFPMSSRNILSVQLKGLFQMEKDMLEAHGEFMSSVTRAGHGDPDAMDQGATAAKRLHDLNAAISQLYGKARLELGFARKEIAFGKWRPHDYSDISHKYRAILLPSVNLGTFLNIMQASCSRVSEPEFSSREMLEAMRTLENHEWDEVLAMSHEPFMEMKKALVEGMDHVMYVLEMQDRPKPVEEDDESSIGSTPAAGCAGFATYLQSRLEKFHEHRETIIQRWCKSKGIDLPLSFPKAAETSTGLLHTTSTENKRRQHQEQLCLVLYIEFLIQSIGKAVLDIVQYADSKVEDGTMKKSRLINPGWRRIQKLFWKAFHPSDTDIMLSGDTTSAGIVWVGDALKTRKDPEHLSPTTVYQKMTHRLRAISRLLSSPEVAFGFRTAIATISIGVVAYLRQTYLFFLQQRGMWSLIMVAISMGSHAGQGVFGFACRVLGTCVAMAASICIYYIGYKQPGAVIPVLFIYLCGGFWIVLKKPLYVKVGIVSMVTCVLIIGYELQAEKIGLQVTTSNGQPFYEIYLLAPYRLAAVCVGLGAAFFWTYVPYPVTTRSTLRKDMGNALYILANYYSVVHTEIQAKLRFGGNVLDKRKDDPMRQLEKAQRTCMQKCVLMLARLREQSDLTKYELTFGGQFPRESYDTLIQSFQRIVMYIGLLSYTADNFVARPEAGESAWLQDFRRIAAEISITSHEVTSMLCLVAAGVTNSQPLPPYLKVPTTFRMATRLQSIDQEILSVKHVAEPCYAAFAVLEVTSTLLTEELGRTVKTVQDLVGSVDFSFHVVSTVENSSSEASTIWGSLEQSSGKGKRE